MTASPHTQRAHGVCSGSLWRQYVCGVPQANRNHVEENNGSASSNGRSKTNKTFDFCVLVGVTMTCYADFQAFKRGDHPTSVLRIVGASAWNTTSTTASETAGNARDTSFRMVTFQGTHIYCATPTCPDRDCWLAALHAGLEASLDVASVSKAVDEPTKPLLNPPSPKSAKPRRGVFAHSRANQVYCHSCGKTGIGGNDLLTSPLPQYGQETKVDVCQECWTSQGLLLDVQRLTDLYEIRDYEQRALETARDMCYAAIQSETTNLRDVNLDEITLEDSSSTTLGDPQKLETTSVPATSKEALLKLIQSPSFTTYRRSCPLLEERCLRLEEDGAPAEFLEGLQQGQSKEELEVGALKKQAFRVAGDMGSAMKLLQDHAQGSHDTDMLSFILDFFLDLCEEGELSSIAFFWPQLRCIHLRMLPPENTQELARVDMLEDFLLTVSVKHSVQLALELVWGHIADLEDSLYNSACAATCRRRRCSVLRFVCELESLLFDFDHGWGGGSVGLRNMLSPSPHQVTLLRQAMLKLQGLRESFPALTRSVRIEKLTDGKQNLPPEAAAQEALRIARNADYFSSHLSFTRRLCDVTERLRFMEVETRAPTLQKEMISLNSSGGMGGDPLNRVSKSLIRVVRIPSREGHVFRSKERTPVLLLMELLQDCADDEDPTSGPIPMSENGTTNEEVNGSSHSQTAAIRAGQYAIDVEMPEASSDEGTNEGSNKSTGDEDAEQTEGEATGSLSSVDVRSESGDDVIDSSDAVATSGGEASAEVGTALHSETGIAELAEAFESPRADSNMDDDYESSLPQSEDDEVPRGTTKTEDCFQQIETSEKISGVPEVPEEAGRKIPPPEDQAGAELSTGTEDTPATNAVDSIESTELAMKIVEQSAPEETIVAARSSLLEDRKAGASSVLGSGADSGMKSSLPTHHSPRALGKFRRFDGPLSSQDELKPPSTPTKAVVKELVNTALHMQLELPSLVETGSDCTDAAIEQTDSEPIEEEPLRSRSPESPSSVKGPLRPSRLNKSASFGNPRKMSAFAASPTDTGDAMGSAPNDEIRREVLTTIMMKAMKGANAIASSAAAGAQRSLQDLDRKRAASLILHGEIEDESVGGPAVGPGVGREDDVESSRKRLQEMGLDDASIGQTLQSNSTIEIPSEDDEAMEALRLLLLQNRVGQGTMTPESAVAAMSRHSSSVLNVSPRSPGSKSEESVHMSDVVEIEAGDVDPRLIGCGSLPPAVLSALTLWKAGVVSNGELLELVKKDLNFIRQSEILTSEHTDKLIEDSNFWGRFAFGERWAEKKARIAACSPEGSLPGWDLTGIIVKSNDDLRQEAFVMQLIELCQEAFEMAGLELWLHPYRILATGKTTGIIEMVRNAMSFDSLKKRPGYGRGGLKEHLKRMTEFTANPVEAFLLARKNFVKSLAAYSLLSYLFMFKDRHNGNILLDTAGHVIHIDFGFVFGIAPGGSFSLEMSTPFKITEEMLEVMGGLESPLFSEFVTLFCCGFLALQGHVDTFSTIVEITCHDSSFKCFEGRDAGEVVSKLRERFVPDLDKQATVAFALDLIKQATTSYGTKQYDYFQYLSQGIAA